MAVDANAEPQRQSVFKSLGNGLMMTLAVVPALSAFYYRGFGSADPMWCSKGLSQLLDLSALSANDFLYHSPTLSLCGLGFVLISTLHLFNLLVGSSWMLAPYWAFVPPLCFAYYSLHPCASFDVERAALVATLVGVWSVKTFVSYLRKERWELGAREDWRFDEMRQSLKGGMAWASSSFFTYYLPFLGTLVMITLPFRTLLFSEEEFGMNVSDWIGSVMCAVGLVVNIIADRQLAEYMAPEEKPHVLHTGLWRYCRHPNHLGDQLFWWGLTVMAVGLGGTWTAWGTVVNAFVAYAVTEMVEKRMLATRARRRAYILYRLGTPRLLPWMPTEVTISKGELRVMAATYSPHAKRRSSNMPLSPASLDSSQATFSSCNVSAPPDEDAYPNAVQRRLEFGKSFDQDMEKLNAQKANEADVSDDEAVSFAISLENVSQDYHSLVVESEEVMANVEQAISESTPPTQDESSAVSSVPQEDSAPEKESVPSEEVEPEEVASKEVESEEVESEEVASEEVVSKEVASEEVASEEVASEEVASEEVVSAPEEVVSEEVASEEDAGEEEAAPEAEEAEEVASEKEVVPEEEEVASEEEAVSEEVVSEKEVSEESTLEEEVDQENVNENVPPTEAAGEKSPSAVKDTFFINPCLRKAGESEESEKEVEAEATENSDTSVEEEPVAVADEDEGERNEVTASKEERAEWIKWTQEDIQQLKVVELRQILKQFGEGQVYAIRKPGLIKLLSSHLEAERARGEEVQEEGKEEEKEESIIPKRSRTPGRKRAATPSRRRRAQTPTRDEDEAEEDKELTIVRRNTPRRKRSASRGAASSVEKDGENANTNTPTTPKSKKKDEVATPTRRIEDLKVKELQVELKKRGESPWGMKKKEMVSLLRVAMKNGEAGELPKKGVRSKLFVDSEEQPILQL